MSHRDTKSEAETSEAKKPSPGKLPISKHDQEWDECSDIDVAVVVCDGKTAYLLRRGFASEILKEKECLTNDQIEHALKQIVNASHQSFTRTMQALRLARTPTDRELECFAALTEAQRKNTIYPKFCDRKHKNEFKSTVADLNSDQLMDRLEKDEQFAKAFQIELIADLLFDQYVTISVGKLMNLATDGAKIYLYGQAAGTPKTMRKTKIIGRVFVDDSDVKEALKYIREGKNDVTHAYFEFFDEKPNRQIYLRNYFRVLQNVDFRSCFPHLGTDLRAKIDEFMVPGIKTHQQRLACLDGFRICNEKAVERCGQLPSHVKSQLEKIQKKYPEFQLVYEVSKRASMAALEVYDVKLAQRFAMLDANNQARYDQLDANNQARYDQLEAKSQARFEGLMEQRNQEGASARARSVSPSQVTGYVGQVDDLSDSEVDGSLSTLCHQ